LVSELSKRFKNVDLEDVNPYDQLEYRLIVGEIVFDFEDLNGILVIRSEGINADSKISLTETRDILDSTKEEIKTKIKNILEGYLFELNDSVTHNKVKNDILSYLLKRVGCKDNFRIHDFKVMNDFPGDLQFKISSKYINWTVSLKSIGFTVEEKRGI
jgi:hypothetical protein